MKNKAIKRAALILLCAAAITAALCLGAFKRTDKWLQDRLFQREHSPSGDIVIIAVDEKSLDALGPYNTWDRTVIASALEALSADESAMPAAVAVDVLFTGESSPEADARLAAAAEKLGCLVTACSAEMGASYEYAPDGRLVENDFAVLSFSEPYEALRDASTQGHINVMADLDGTVRHALLYIDLPDGRRIYSMAYETARVYSLALGGDAPAEPYCDARGNFYIPYTARPGGFSDGLSIVDLIRGEIPADRYAGKIVLIGPYAAGLQDSYFTPIDRAGAMYGVELQANVIQSLLEGEYRREAPLLPQALALFAVCALCCAVFTKKRVGVSGIVFLAVCALSVAASLALCSAGIVTRPLWIPLGAAAAYLGSIVLHYLAAARERRRIRNTFERYVAPEIVGEILKEGEDSLALGGRLCEIAVLFVDIRGFTTMSERLSPEEVVSILNRYLSMTSRCVAAHRGTLDKFVGDATMAFWGAPLKDDEAVLHACMAALDIVKGASELSNELTSERGEGLRVGVGVHFGPAVVGNMGSERRMDYTAIGDTVNTAARLEANAPGGCIYVSRAVADAMGDRASFRSLGGSVPLKGKKEGFEVLILEGLK